MDSEIAGAEGDSRIHWDGVAGEGIWISERLLFGIFEIIKN